MGTRIASHLPAADPNTILTSGMCSRCAPALTCFGPIFPLGRCLSLGRAVELLLTTEGTGFEFVAASAALDFIDETIRDQGWHQKG